MYVGSGITSIEYLYTTPMLVGSMDTMDRSQQLQRERHLTQNKPSHRNASMQPQLTSRGMCLR